MKVKLVLHRTNHVYRQYEERAKPGPVLVQGISELGLNIKQAENLSEVEKREIDQLIFDIRENEWYCEQGDSESQMEDWEKKLIIDGLKRLLEVEE